MRILFTGVGRRVELIQAFKNAALVLKKNLRIYGAEMELTAPALEYCDYKRKVVAMKDPEYVNNLLQICEEDRIDLVIPTIDTDLFILSENKKRFEAKGTRVMISTPDKIRICRDKYLTNRFFLQCGLNAPSTSRDWKDYKGNYPAFIKPIDGSSSINAYKVNNEMELAFYAKQIISYVVQPYVEGKEYTVDIFCNWEGKPFSITPRERLQVRSGEVLKTQIVLDERIIDQCQRLCKEFKACGPITVQLIRDEKGTDWFIEINPRFGGGSPLSMKAGANSAEAILRLLDGEEISYYNNIADGAVYSRFDQSVCIKEGKGQVKGVIFDLDDTLYSEKEYVQSGYHAVSNYLGGNYEEILWNYFEEGKPAISELLRTLGRQNEENEVLGIYREHIPQIHLYEGVVELIHELKVSGKKVGIITDGRPGGQKKKIDALGLKNLVDDIIITDELGGIQFRKPCDIAFRIMQTRWRLNPFEIIYIGDNLTKDFQAPKQLGMKSLWFNNEEGIYKSKSEVGRSFIDIKSIIDMF